MHRLQKEARTAVDISGRHHRTAPHEPPPSSRLRPDLGFFDAGWRYYVAVGAAAGEAWSLSKRRGPMRRRKLVVTVGCLLACGAMLVTWVASRSGMHSLTLAIVDRGTNGAGLRSVLLLLTNGGPYRICYPDGFFVQTRGAARPVYVPTTNLWLEPGDDATIQATLPSSPTDWCGVVSYYAESPWNRIKMRLSSSSIGGKLPSAFTTVRGAELKSPWMTD
jgi:hypothetical protein